MDWQDLVKIWLEGSAFVATFCLGFVALVKESGVKGNVLRVISTAIGIIAGLLVVWGNLGGLPASPAQIVATVIYSGLMGLLASGIYDLGKGLLRVVGNGK